METQALIEIVRRAQNGDSRAQQELYLDGSKSVYFNALKILRSKEDAEDITQDVFITVFEKLPELKNPAAYYKWVNQITANKCMSFLRKHKPIPTDDVILDILELDESDAETPEKLLDDEATRLIIMEIIDALPDSQRVCVMYRYFNQLSIDEIAALTETNEHTVKSRLALARNKIRAAILEKEEKDGTRLHVLIPIMPVLMKALDEFTMPDGLQARMWDNIQKSLAGSDSPGAEQTGSPEAVHNSGAASVGTNSAAKTVGKVILGMTAKKAVTAALIVLLAGALITAGVIFLPKMLNPADPTNTPGVSGTETPGTTTPDNTPGATDTTPDDITAPDNTPDAPKDPVVLLPDPVNINEEYLDDMNNHSVSLGYFGGGEAVDNYLDEIYKEYGRYLNENISKNCVKLGIFSLFSFSEDIGGITPEALKKVNELLKTNGEKPLNNMEDPKQKIAALWIAASLYYEPDYSDDYKTSFWQDYPGGRFDIAQAFALARHSEQEDINTFTGMYASFYAYLFNIAWP